MVRLHTLIEALAFLRIHLNRHFSLQASCLVCRADDKRNDSENIPFHIFIYLKRLRNFKVHTAFDVNN